MYTNSIFYLCTGVMLLAQSILEKDNNTDITKSDIISILATACFFAGTTSTFISMYKYKIEQFK